MTSAPVRTVRPEPSPLLAKTLTRGTPARRIDVTGVLVVHDGEAWLPDCLDAVANQTRPLDRLVVVDTGSRDHGMQIVAAHRRIREVVGEVRVILLPRGSTFGEAVGRAVESLARPADSRRHWLWLLHDDSAPAPQALVHLLDAARRSPSVGVAGPKLATWDDPSRLLEVGRAITRTGRRAGGPAPGEPDQGQHDHRADVLAVSTSGMLIRYDVFDTLGGFDPAFGQFREDLDLCWRAHLAGHRVVVAPRALLREAAASTNGQRAADLSAAAARRRDRSHCRQVALARCSLVAMPMLALWIVLASLGSAAALLVVKRPREAWVELGDIGSLLTPWHPLAARWRSRGIRRVRRRDLRRLFVSPGDGLGHTLDGIRDAVGLRPARRAEEPGGAPSPETGPVSDDAELPEAPARGVGSRIIRHPGFLAVLAGTALAGATWRSLLGALVSTSGMGFAGGELLPGAGSASELWHGWLDGWHGPGLGNAVEPAPYLPVLSAGAWLLEHMPLVNGATSSVGVLIGWLLVAAIPLSAWTAYLGARVVTRAGWPRAWAALAWASLATLTNAAAGGRLGAVLAHILLPLVAAGFVCAARRSTPYPATFAAAVALGVTGAFNPALAVCGALAALVLLVVGRGVTRLRALVLLLVPIGLLGPWILRLADHPLLLLGGPGLTVWRGASAAPWQLTLLHPGGPGGYGGPDGYPAWLSAPVVLAGVIAMARRESGSRALTALAALTVVGLALGVAAPHLVIGQVPQDLAGAGSPISPITAWAGTGLDLAALALVAAATLGFGGLSGWLLHSGFSWRQLLFVPVVAAAVLGVAASAAMAGWLGVGKNLTAAVPTIPAVAADQADAPLANRLLVLQRRADTIGYRLVGHEPGPVVRDLPPVAAAPDPLLEEAVKSTVRTDGAGSARAARDRLADLAVGFVGFRGAATDPLVSQLDATGGLTRLGDSRGLVLWRLLPRQNAVSSSRLRLLDAKGAPLESVAVTGDHASTEAAVGPATPPRAARNRPLAGGRRLVVAEPPAWAGHARVRFAGRALTAVTSGEQPTYLVPAEGGHLSIELGPTYPRWRWGQLGLLLIVVFLAAPFGSSRPRTTSVTTSRPT